MSPTQCIDWDNHLIRVCSLFIVSFMQMERSKLKRSLALLFASF